MLRINRDTSNTVELFQRSASDLASPASPASKRAEQPGINSEQVRLSEQALQQAMIRSNQDSLASTLENVEAAGKLAQDVRKLVSADPQGALAAQSSLSAQRLLLLLEG